MTPEREVDDRIADWVDGRLVGKDRDRFVAELRVNPQLRQDLERYEQTVASVRAALQAETRPVQLADRVLEAIAAGRAAPVRHVGGWRWRPVLWSVATAAALLALALLVDAWFGAGPRHANLTAQHDARFGANDGAARFEPADGKVADPSWHLQPGDPAEPSTDKEVKRVAVGTALERATEASEPEAKDDAQRQTRKDQANATKRAGRPDGVQSGPIQAPAGPAAPAPPTGGPPAPPRDAEAAGGHDASQDRSEAPMPVATGAIRDGATGEPVGESRAAEEELAKTAPTAAPEPAGDPLPLVVVQGLAPAAAELFLRRTREKSESSDLADRAAAGGEARRRLDEFLTAQVAQLGRTTVPERPPEPRSEPRSDWVRVANLRLRQIDPVVPPAGAEADRRAAADRRQRAAEPQWVERDWLVEGSRPEVAALLQRLATFARESELQLLTGETTDVAAERLREGQPEAGLAATAADEAATRIVLRFRMQTR